MDNTYSLQIETKPFDNDFKLYLRKNFTFKPGVNSLVGCNGSGKSTLIDCFLKPDLKKHGIRFIDYNDRQSGGQNLMSKMGFLGDFQGLAGMLTSSEGERIVNGLSPIFSSMRQFLYNNRGEKAFIILDAIDSGMSVDEIIEIRDTFLDVVLPDAKSHFDAELYIVIAANNYEWCNDNRINNIDISTGKELNIDSYETYKTIILKSRQTKNKLRGITDSE